MNSSLSKFLTYDYFSRFAPVSEVTYKVKTCSNTPKNIKGDYTVEVDGQVPATLIDSTCDLNVSKTVSKILLSLVD